MNYQKHIWEGWTVQDFINELEVPLKLIMSGQSFIKPFKQKSELKKWCINNQPHYKKYIPEVVIHFCNLYNIK